MHSIEACGLANTVLKEQFLKRKGGRIGTAGIAAVALRLDHGTDAIASHLLEMLHERGLTATLALFSRMREDAYGDGLHTTPWSTIQSWSLNHGLECAGHGATHDDATTETGLRAELIDSLAEMSSYMPRVKIEQFLPPGVHLGGIGITSKASDLFETVGGHMALSSYALVSAYVGGYHRSLDGVAAQGMTHYTIDKSTPATVKRVIQQAQADGGGLALMLHPQFVGLPNRMDWDQVAAVLDFIAAERDAGRLMLLTLGGLALADATATHRHDLIRDPTFSEGSTRWAGKGWTMYTGTVASSVPGSRLSQLVDLSRKEWALGGSRELQWVLSSDGGGQATILVEDSDNPDSFRAARTVEIPRGRTIKVNQFCTIPFRETKSLRVAVVLTQGNDLRASEAHLFAA